MSGSKGLVALVGAGPGDPGLLTARALELISGADVILYDRLIPDGALDGARPGADLVYVGKTPGADSMSQEDITALLVEKGRSGGMVVRLKGGDPFVFGRGGEEALALASEGIDFEVVPGITAGIAAPAHAGIPVTHRDRASAVAFITGHEDPDKPESAIDWPALAAFPGTLVFYMGVRQLPRIASELQAGGRSGEQPAAVIERGTLPGQRSVHGTLATIAGHAADAAIRAPSITVVGDVAGLGEELAWRDTAAPLLGRTVAVTRARAQAGRLAARLRGLGATVVEAPVIRIEPLPATVPDLGGYDLVCLTSPNGAHLLFDRLAAQGLDARALAGPRIAAIGPGTARALAERGVDADIVPERFVAEGLLEALGGTPVKRALVARAREARETLPDGLRKRGAEVDVLPLYETVAEPLDGAALSAVRSADYVTFTASSTVSFFLEAAGGKAGLSAQTRIVSIGPVTTSTLGEHGLQPQVEAERHDIDGLVEALCADVDTGTGSTVQSDRTSSPEA